jgi:hypothetical protein
MTTKVKNPMVVSPVFSNEDFSLLKTTMLNAPKTPEVYDEGFGRYHVWDPILTDFTQKALVVAKEVFESDTLVPSYTLFSHYQGEKANLLRHKDDNACTYTIDMCVYQDTPWDLWVDGAPYTLLENQALAYYGNDQEHWREEFPNPDSNYVAMVFFHFVEPDHWWVTKGPEWIHVLRGTMTEEDFYNAK